MMILITLAFLACAVVFAVAMIAFNSLICERLAIASFYATVISLGATIVMAII